MSKILISRLWGFVNLVRRIFIFNPEEKIGEIGNGETKEFAVEMGQLKISAWINWAEFQSSSIAIQDGEVRKFKLSSRNPDNPMAVSQAKNNGLFLRLKN